jgi:NADPH-dependent 7-cyano-7-deazaguanine reductase QueF
VSGILAPCPHGDEYDSYDVVIEYETHEGKALERDSVHEYIRKKYDHHDAISAEYLADKINHDIWRRGCTRKVSVEVRQDEKDGVQLTVKSEAW